MKSAFVLAAALALCGSAFANTVSQKAHNVMSTVRQDAHQIGSSFSHDVRRVARGDTWRQSQGMAASQHASHTTAMGAGPSDGGRQARMDAAYARWQRTHR